MAARTRKIRHDAETREKIRAAHIIRRFQLHFNGKLELSKDQISTGKILLDKCLPDLQSVEYSGDVTVTRPASEMTDDELAAIIARLEGSTALEAHTAPHAAEAPNPMSDSGKLH